MAAFPEKERIQMHGYMRYSAVNLKWNMDGGHEEDFFVEWKQESWKCLPV